MRKIRELWLGLDNDGKMAVLALTFVVIVVILLVVFNGVSW